MAAYVYVISTDTANGRVDPTSLTVEINDSTITTPLVDMTTGDDLLTINFSGVLTAPELATLTSVVNATTGLVPYESLQGGPMATAPTYIPIHEVATVVVYAQVLAVHAITVDGVFQNDGLFIFVPGT